MSDLNHFINAYKAICERFGYYIAACGHCNSPWISKYSSNKELDYNIQHLVNIIKQLRNMQIKKDKKGKVNKEVPWLFKNAFDSIEESQNKQLTLF